MIYIETKIVRAIRNNNKLFGRDSWVNINDTNKGQIYHVGSKYIYMQESDYYCPKECYYAQKYEKSCGSPCKCKGSRLNINDIKTIEEIEPMW